MPASFAADLKQVEKANRRVIAPSQNIPAAWILQYDPQNTDHLIRLGTRMRGGR